MGCTSVLFFFIYLLLHFVINIINPSTHGHLVVAMDADDIWAGWADPSLSHFICFFYYFFSPSLFHLPFFLLHHARLLLLPFLHPLLPSLIPETHVRRVRKIEKKDGNIGDLDGVPVGTKTATKKKVRLDDPDGLVTQ